MPTSPHPEPSTPAAIKSEILVGYSDYGPRSGEAHKIELEAIPKHVLACGTTGSGKTVCLKVVAESLLARNIPICCIDVMGDLAGLAVPAGSPEVYRRLGLPEPLEVSEKAWSLGRQVADRLEKIIHARYLTPCSDIGERMAISPLPMKPKYFEEEYQKDRDEVELQASTAAWALMGKIGLKQPRDGVGGEPELVRGLIFEVIIKAWQEDLDLNGVDGIENFLTLSKQVFAKRMPGNQESKYEAGLRSLSTGQAARWLEGTRVDWDALFTVPKGKTPLIIIALEHIPREQHPWVVSQVVSSLAGWCSIQPPTPGRPRVGLLIDELAGEGGRNSLLPHLTYSSASGTALRHVLRKGRHWGLGLLAGSQSPSDIDGRSFTFFNTTFAGRLKTDHDVRLALSGGNLSGDKLKKLSGVIKSSTAPRMFYTNARGWCESIQVRWLGTLHSRIERHQVAKLYQSGHFQRPGSGVESNRWTYHDQRLHDRGGRLVAVLTRGTAGIVTALIDSAGTGIESAVFALSTEGLLRASLWIGSRSGSRGVSLVCRDGEDQRILLDMARKAEIPIHGNDRPWHVLPPRCPTDPAGLVAAVHQVVLAAGCLAQISTRDQAAA